ncbi:MAG: hypothetical protein LUG51_04075 [Tannerellaceae bacterium]|nr:hypothetical protein [Tannerellaceae bacterium]
MKWFVTLLFIAYYSSVHVFTHVHIENGIAVVHTHPFKKAAGDTSHHHTSSAEIYLFQDLSTIQIESAGILLVNLHFYAQSLADLTKQPGDPGHSISYQGVCSLRAPPVA